MEYFAAVFFAVGCGIAFVVAFAYLMLGDGDAGARFASLLVMLMCVAGLYFVSQHRHIVDCAGSVVQEESK